MSAVRPCSQCGAVLPAHAPGARCPKCLLRFALDPVAAEEGVPPSEGRTRLHYFGDYELIEQIARGGMGVVYKARQVSLNRIVAVKMLLAGPFSSEDYVRRFRTEAQAAASLQHPHIVAIHEVGEHEGRQYFSMEYVEGTDLSDMVQQQPLPAVRAAQLTRTLAEAIHYAHQRGIIHRDLKPSNILLDANGQPRVTDFGLAKFVENTSAEAPPAPKRGRWDTIVKRTRVATTSHLTLTGQVLGTPGFMPPEQASGRRSAVTKASDIYSLGAILYFLLTGRAPFATDSLEATLRQVLEAEPVAPRLLNSEVPRDLETLCLRCLEKDPQRRFASAQELAEELGRFLEGKPIRSRPVSVPEKVWRWCGRHPAIAALAIALATATGAGFFGINWQLRQTKANEVAARRNAYAADMNLVQASLQANNLRRARELLDRNRPRPGQLDLRGWEWRRAWQECQSEATATLHTGVKLPLCMTFLDSQLFVGTQDGDIVRFDFDGQSFSNAKGLGKSGQDVAMAAIPDRQLLAVTEQRGKVRVMDREGGHQSEILAHGSAVWSLSSSSDGKYLATSGFDGLVKIWNWRSNLLLRTITSTRPRAMYFGDVAFAPSGHLLAIGQSNGRLRLVDASNGAELWSVAAHQEQISALAFSPDGQLLASGTGYGDATIKVWSARSGEARATLKGHTSWTSGLVFSPDGRKLASSSADQTIRLWDTDHWEEIKSLRGHSREVHCLAFSPGGDRLASADQDGTINVWDVSANGRPAYPAVLPGKYSQSRISRDDTRIFSVDQGTVVINDLAALREAARLTPLGTNNTTIALSSDEQVLAVGDKEGRIKVWDLTLQRVSLEIPAYTNAVDSVALSHDGRFLFSIGQTRRVHRWSMTDGRLEHEWEWEKEPSLYRSRFLPAHSFWVTGHRGHARVRNLMDGRPIATLTTDEWIVDDFNMSADGKWIATASQSGVVVIFDTRTWQRRATLHGHLTGVAGVAFSPDGSRLLTGSNGREAVKLWDTMTWQELATLPTQGSLFKVVFSPGGRMVIAISNGLKLHLWRAPSFEEINQAERNAVKP